MTKEQLTIILEEHKLWHENKKGGRKANLRDADLHDANLRGANLHDANLRGADLSYTDLRGADLSYTDLRDADLHGADLRDADLHGADLRHTDLSYTNLRGANLSHTDLYDANLSYTDLHDANLRGANLHDADLHDADLHDADLHDANLHDANLHGANLHGANLRDANLYGADLHGAIYPIVCPEKGAFIAFKKASGYIVELMVTEDAKRYSATTRKCRCSKAVVLSITTPDGHETNLTEVKSDYDSNFIYRLGEVVETPDFCEDRWKECSQGIHFFITRNEAVNYQ